MAYYEVVPLVASQHDASPDFPDYEVIKHAGQIPSELYQHFGMCSQKRQVYFMSREEAQSVADRRTSASSRSFYSYLNG